MRFLALAVLALACTKPPPDLGSARMEYRLRLLTCSAERGRVERAATAKERELAGLAASFQCGEAAAARAALILECRRAFDDLRCQQEADRVRNGGSW